MGNSDRSERIRAGRHAAGRAESAESTAGDPRLRQLQQSLGNEAMRDQLNQGNRDRSTMLAHVVDRLVVMQELQRREMNLLVRGSSFDWWRDVARSDSGEVSIPDPNRWHEAAEAYKEASEVLSRGDLERGHQLLERAMEVEDRTVEQMTELVSLHDLQSDARPDASVLDGLVSIGQLEPIEPPPGVAIADRILVTQIDPPKTPEIRRTASPWWALEEEEEDEGDGDGGGDEPGGG